MENMLCTQLADLRFMFQSHEITMLGATLTTIGYNLLQLYYN